MEILKLKIKAFILIESILLFIIVTIISCLLSLIVYTSTMYSKNVSTDVSLEKYILEIYEKNNASIHVD